MRPTRSVFQSVLKIWSLHTFVNCPLLPLWKMAGRYRQLCRLPIFFSFHFIFHNDNFLGGPLRQTSIFSLAEDLYLRISHIIHTYCTNSHIFFEWNKASVYWSLYFIFYRIELNPTLQVIKLQRWRLATLILSPFLAHTLENCS